MGRRNEASHLTLAESATAAAAVVVAVATAVVIAAAAEDDKKRDDDEPYALVVENVAKAVIHKFPPRFRMKYAV